MIEKTCIICRHWFFDGGSPDYSPETPGDQWESGCGLNHWIIDQPSSTGSETFREFLLKANNCVDFSDVKNSI